MFLENRRKSCSVVVISKFTSLSILTVKNLNEILMPVHLRSHIILIERNAGIKVVEQDMLHEYRMTQCQRPVRISFVSLKTWDTNLCQNCATPLGNSKRARLKTKQKQERCMIWPMQNVEIPYYFFLITIPRNSTSFLFGIGISACSFFSSHSYI